MHVHELIETATLTVGTESFYGDTFRDCRLILSPGGNPRFFNCVFVNCEFEPPYPASNIGPPWADGMFGCVINP